MSRTCQISGKSTASGNSVSHSHRKTRRKFKVNLVSKKVFLADENRWVQLKMSARMLKTLNKRGVKSLIKKYGQDLSVLKAASKGK
jgi:ribosomal protein L28